MALEEFQKELELDTLYEVKLAPIRGLRAQITPSLWINSGAVDVYASNSATEPAALSNMTLNEADTEVSGIATIDLQGNTLPKYIAVTQNSGTSTEVIASGLSIKDLGAIS